MNNISALNELFALLQRENEIVSAEEPDLQLLESVLNEKSAVIDSAGENPRSEEEKNLLHICAGLQKDNITLLKDKMDYVEEQMKTVRGKQSSLSAIKKYAGGSTSHSFNEPG